MAKPRRVVPLTARLRRSYGTIASLAYEQGRRNEASDLIDEAIAMLCEYGSRTSLDLAYATRRAIRGESGTALRSHFVY